MTTLVLVKTVAVVKTASYKSLLFLALSIAIMCLLMGQNFTNAQGFLPGAPTPTGGTAPDPLAGAGSIGTALGSLGGLIDDFTFDKFLDFACQAATAANGEAQSGESQGAQDTICTITSMFTEVEGLFDENEQTMEESQGLFADSSLFGMNVGNLIAGNPGQLEGVMKEIEAFLAEKDPSKMTEMARATFEKMAVTEARNYEVATPGSIQGDFNTAMESNPQLGMAHVQGLYQQADLNTKVVENMAALEGSRGIAQAMSDSTAPDKLVEAITPGKDKKGVAPAIRDEANAAVSTRATVQEVVEAITYYMEQDVRQFAYLSEQLTLQAQQQVYTGKMLQMSADAILAEQKQENSQARAKLEAAVHEVTVQVTDSGEKVTTMARALVALGTPESISFSNTGNLDRLTNASLW
jgi:hypothetical protein